MQADKITITPERCHAKKMYIFGRNIKVLCFKAKNITDGLVVLWHLNVCFPKSKICVSTFNPILESFMKNIA